MYGSSRASRRGARWPIPRPACCLASACCGRGGLPYFALFVVAIGFMITWARSTGAPLVPITVFATVAALGSGYPAIGRVLRRRVRIKRSA
jgi:hypothetical protein